MVHVFLLWHVFLNCTAMLTIPQGADRGRASRQKLMDGRSHENVQVTFYGAPVRREKKRMSTVSRNNVREKRYIMLRFRETIDV